jgi:dihydrofolate reductase
MGNIVAIEHLTLDGVYQGPARPDEDTRDGFTHGGWGAAAGSDPKLQAAIGAHMGDAWSLLVGRVTYEDLYGFWPKQAPNPMTDALNNVEKFVASHNPDYPLPWQNSTLLQGDAAEAVAKLKKEHDKTLVIFGSGVLVRSLIEYGLIDELVLQLHPLLLGKGRRLFEDTPHTKLKLSDSVTMDSGLIVATYQPAQKSSFIRSP